MKKVVALVLAVLMVTMVAGCGAAEGPKRAAYIARTLSDAFASWLANEMQRAAAQYSDTFTLEVLDSRGDSERQNASIEMCITQGYDLIIVQPNDGESQRPFVEEAVAAGILVITTNALIPGISGGSSVDADPYNQGAVLAKAAAEMVPQGGKVVILSCLPGNLHTTARYQSFQDLFVDKRPDVEIIGNHIFNEVDPAGAMAFIEDLMQSKGQIDAVLTSADVLALAALEAVRGNPLYDNMLAWGVDGLSGSLISIKEGKQTGSCLQNAVELAEKNMKAAYQLLTGAQTVVEDSIGEVYLDSSNVDEWLAKYVDYGLLTKEEIAHFYE